ncbi:GNAT family N-acetyltransferase [Saccharibacillus kuerlensis]|uniref:N-acetyltransferase domain-containing protein n=1 Tax=Saccharibacillus kuerlensis TaxID=459527 RepID=A0ABQ2KQF1_9BACL|nr:GNAT family N-acetyltransferase [Saccharibacillus kuerlensis]GGN90116.1 hypothetical protein GCM10010969_00230 [Saccharibacillus kuerlensis]
MERDQIDETEEIGYEAYPERLPIELLEKGDPLKWRIETYLQEADWWTLRENGQIVTAVGCLRMGAEEAEIVNAAIMNWKDDNVEQLRRVLQIAAAAMRDSGVRRLVAYTGNWETKLAKVYQRSGFRIIAVEPDYYTNSRLQPVKGNDLPKQDRLMLEFLTENLQEKAVDYTRISAGSSAAGPIVRRIELHDSQKLLAMKKQLDRETTSMLYEPGERRMTDGDQLEQVRMLLRSSNSMMWVAEYEGQIVGYLEATGGKVRRNQHTVYVVIGILEPYTGQGLGRTFFRELFDWAARRQILRAELTVQAPNQRAYRLYRSIGFKLEGIMRSALIIEGESIDLYQMGCDMRTIHLRQG